MSEERLVNEVKNIEQIRDFIKLQRTKVENKYSYSTYDDAEWYCQEGKKLGYDDSLDDLEIFLNSEGKP